MSDRLHAFEAIDNFRDYGDYATAAGRRIRPGRLLRSGHHARASEADLERLKGLGLGAVVDLRRPGERRDQPSRRHDGFDALVIEGSDSPYVNILVARPDNKDSADMQKLAKALHSPEVKQFILEKYKGAVVPAF